MKILCAKCFTNITDINKSIAVCDNCGTTYVLQQKASIFRVLLDGGYIKEGMTYDEITKGIENGNILPDEYIATYNGPWIAIFDSPFAKFIKPHGGNTYDETRRGIYLYRVRRTRSIAVTILSIFFSLSLITNIVLLWIISNMDKKIEELILKVTGG